MEHFNGLTASEHERLSLLMEECGEVVHAIGKIFRHGFESNWNGGETNRQMLARELGDLGVAITFLLVSKDYPDDIANVAYKLKVKKLPQFLHHQYPATIAAVENF